MRYLLLAISLLCLGGCGSDVVYADMIDMNAIKTIESHGNPLAYNKSSGARGLYQITNIVLIEFNQYHPSAKHTQADLFNPATNTEIATWYMSKRIPQLLRHFKKPVTINNILIAYNAGINYVVKGKRLPTETQNYIKKYKNLVSRT